MVATAEKATRGNGMKGGLVVSAAMQRWLTENGNAPTLMAMIGLQTKYRETQAAKTYIGSLAVEQLRDREAKLIARLDKIADELLRRA